MAIRGAFLIHEQAGGVGLIVVCEVGRGEGMVAVRGALWIRQSSSSHLPSL